MCQSHKTQECHFVPSYVLEHIAQSSAAPERARAAALKTLAIDQKIRELRDSGVHQDISDGIDVTPAQVPITPALSGPAAVDGIADADAGPLTLKRVIFDAQGKFTLPGVVVRQEGAERLPDRQVNNVYDGVGITLKFFHTVFGRNSLNGEGGSVIATVHYDETPNDGLGYNNAKFNGTQVMFGDGDGIVFDYTGDSLDIVAHELTHGITRFTADLIYERQSGGLNESMSDVFAAMVEQWHFGQTSADADWLLGQNLFPIAVKGAALRDIANPGTAFNDPVLGFDRQISHFRDYNDDLNVHQTSGIPNRAFYLTAIGLGGFSYNTAGKIWYATLTDKRIRRDASFKEFADITVEHALKIFNAAAAVIVRKAWVDVGVLA